MKEIINGIIVVEGKSDVAFLSSFIDAEFVITNGSEIPQKTIEYLQNSSEKRDIYILTDPDSSGKRIRDMLDQKIPNLKHCFVSKEKSIKNGKVGVAESTKEEILLALKNTIETKPYKKSNITISDLISLGLIGDEGATIRRKAVTDKYHLGFCNAKTFQKRVNYSNITIEDLKNCL